MSKINEMAPEGEKWFLSMLVERYNCWLGNQGIDNCYQDETSISTDKCLSLLSILGYIT